MIQNKNHWQVNQKYNDFQLEIIESRFFIAAFFKNISAFLKIYLCATFTKIKKFQVITKNM